MYAINRLENRFTIKHASNNIFNYQYNKLCKYIYIIYVYYDILAGRIVLFIVIAHYSLSKKPIISEEHSVLFNRFPIIHYFMAHASLIHPEQ